jgi:hypothetical protein
MLEKVLIAVVVVPLAILVIRGIWRATAVQSDTGCPVCDAMKGGAHHDHDEHAHQQDK